MAGYDQGGPWDENGNLRSPGPPMPDLWPLLWFWAQVGKDTLAEHNHGELR
jgi:hypothetical protein